MITLAWTLAGIVTIILIVAIFRWTADYCRPKYRRYSWNERRIVHYYPRWQPWFAWRPVRTVSGQVVWWITIYRSIGNDYVDHDNWRWYHYADEFDLLRCA